MAKGLSEEEVSLLRKRAEEAFRKAICPFSNFAVGCAILLQDGRTITGFNIEYSSFPASICAERVALASALSQYGMKKDDIKAVGIYLDSKKIGSPCEICRQCLFEDCPGETPVYMFNKTGMEALETVEGLLPHGFGKDNLTI